MTAARYRSLAVKSQGRWPESARPRARRFRNANLWGVRRPSARWTGPALVLGCVQAGRVSHQEGGASPSPAGQG